MSDHVVETREIIAVSDNTRIEVSRDGVVHVLVGPMTLHLDERRCEELTTTLARAMLRLVERRRTRPTLQLLRKRPP